jgi:SAP domain
MTESDTSLSSARLTLQALKSTCRERGLLVGGNKTQLAKRLEDQDAGELGATR